MKRGCGPCNLCCKLLAVPDINKPARMLCWHTGVHGGCAVQGQKPDPEKVGFNSETAVYSFPPEEAGKDLKLLSCAQFKCVWLESQDLDDPKRRGVRDMRPDQCHVVLGPFDREDHKLLYIHVDPEYPDAWKKPPISDYITEIMSKGARVEVIIGEVRVEVGMPSPDTIQDIPSTESTVGAWNS